MVIEEPAVRALYAMAVVLAVGVATVLWRNREKTGAQSLAVTTIGGACWAGALFLSTLEPEALAVFAIQLMYAPVGVTIAAGVVFALEFTGRERYVTRTTLAVLAVHPVVVTVVALTNPGGIFFAGLDPTAAIGVEQRWNVGFWIHSAYGYLLTSAVILLIVEHLVRSKRTLYRGQAAGLALGIASGLFFNGLYLGGVVTFDTTAIGFILLAAFFAVSIVRYQFSNLSPIAHEKIIDNVRDGIVVVDTDDTIVEGNPAASRLFGVNTSLIGRSVYDLFAAQPDLIATYELLTDSVTESRREIVYGDHHIAVDVTPITDDRGRHVGWLFLLADVTAQIQRERDLKRQVDRLDQFAEIVSHDLRNPITIARGYTEQTKATGDLEWLEETEEALDRMDAIIDDVLALTRSGGVTDPEELSLARIVTDAWGTVDTQGARLEITDPAEKIQIVADEDSCRRLFENLIRNSIQHGVDDDHPVTSHTVTIDVAAESGGTVTIIVADNGVGIPPEDRTVIFDDGYTTGGTGLGLTIVEGIVTAHDWMIDVSESETGGVAFEISGVAKPLSSE